jgi:hypothetical protein
MAFLGAEGITTGLGISRRQDLAEYHCSIREGSLPAFRVCQENFGRYLMQFNMQEAQMSRKFWHKIIFKKIISLCFAGTFAVSWSVYALESPIDKMN